MTAAKISLIVGHKNKQEDEDISKILTNLGYKISLIEYPGDKIESKIKKQFLSLVILDMSPGKKTGWFALAQRIDKICQIPIVFIAANIAKTAQEQIHSTDHFSFLKRPFTREELRCTVELAITKYSLQKKLAESYSWTDVMLKSIGDGIIMTDQDGRISFMNPVAEELTGWSREDAEGQELEKVFHIVEESSGERVKNPLDKILHKGEIFKPANHTLLLSKDGKQIPIEDSGAPIRDERGDILGGVLIFRDITERRKSEAELTRERDSLASLMHYSPDYIYFKDLDSRFIRVSKTMADIFGIDDPEDAIGKTDFDFHTAEHAKATFEDEQNIIRTGVPIIGVEEKETLVDGTETWVSTTKMPYYDKAGKIIGTFGISRDITEHRKAEIALEHEKMLMDAMMNNFPEYIYFKDLGSRFYRISKILATDVFGLDDPKEAIGKSDFDFFPSEHAQKDYNEEQKIIKTGKPIIDDEVKTNWADGSVSWASTTKMPLRDDKGKTIGIFGISKDITSRKQAEEDLKQEKSLMDAMMNNFPEYIYFKDLKSRFLRISKVLATEVFGLEDPKEAIGKSDFDFFPPDHAQKDYDEEQEIVKTGKPIIDNEVRTDWADGSVSWASTTKMPLCNDKGKIIGTFGITRNTTEHRKMEEALEKERNLLRTLIENIPDKIYVKDREGRFLICNKALATRMGVSDPEKVIGKTDIDFLDPELAAKLRADEASIVQTGQAIINQEEPLDRLSGGVKWNLTTKVPLRDNQDNIIGIVGIGRDITERKEAEKSFKYEKTLMDALMNYIPDSIYFKDTKCRLIKVSQTMVQNLGLEDDSQIIGKTDVELFGEEFGRETVCQDKEQMKSGERVTNLIEERKLKDGKSNWTSTSKVPIRDEKGKIIGLVGITREINELKVAEQERDKIIKDLQEALKKVNTLQGLIPICANCKKIRNDDGYYEQVEKYIMDHSGAVFSHGICPECMAKLYPDFSKNDKKKP